MLTMCIRANLKFLWGFLVLYLSSCSVVSGQHNHTSDHGFLRPFFSSLSDNYTIERTVENVSDWSDLYPDSAISVLNYTLAQSRQSGYLPGVIASFINLGNIYNRKGMYTESQTAFHSAVNIILTSDREAWKTLPIIYNSLGNTYLAQGSYEQAAAYYEQAAQIASQYRLHHIIGSIYNNFAGVLSRMKQYDKALYYLTLSEKSAKETGNNKLFANVMSNKGTVYMHQQKWNKSLFYFEYLLSFSQKHDLTHATFLTLVNIGNIFLQQDMPRRAITYLRQANALTYIASPVHTAVLYITLGKTYQRLGDTKHAVEYLEKAIAKAQEAGADDERADAHQSLAAVYAAIGNYKEAFIQKELHEELRDKIENRDIFININQMETRYRTTQKDKELIQKQLLIQQQQLRLEHKNLLIYGSMAGILLLTIVLASLYRSHTHKQRLQTNQIRLLQREQELSLREKEITELKAMMRGEEKERTRIARDLHDGVVSSLSATRLNLSTLAHRMQANTFKTEFKETIKQLTDSIQELRITAQNLTSETLLQNGLQEAVFSFCKKMEAASGLEIDFNIYGLIPDIEVEFELSIYRMTQELIHNAIKHANASLLTVQFSCRENWLGVTVEDNGTGMPNTLNSGTGIANIRSRVKAVNGQMNITSDHSGTTVYLEFNLQQTEKTTPHADQTGHM